MGGFEGGDEGGYWDVDTLPSSIGNQNTPKPKNPNSENSYIEKTDLGYSIKAHARVTPFLKITGYKEGTPTLLSRYLRVEDLYDTISFVPCSCETFTIQGCEEIPKEANSIYKIYQSLIDFTDDWDIEAFFHEHKIVVTKRIPYSVGLAGSASDAAAFLRLAKEACNLVLTTKELIEIGSTVGRDVAFFIYNYPSANVSGCGEVVQSFEEEALNVELYTPKIQSDETLVCQTYEKDLYTNSSLTSFEGWDKLDSKSIIERTADPIILNDLYAAALLAYPDLIKVAKNGWLFSASGSTFFRLLN